MSMKQEIECFTVSLQGTQNCLAYFLISKMGIILECTSQDCCEDKIKLVQEKHPWAGFLEKTDPFTLSSPMHSMSPLSQGPGDFALQQVP